MRRLNRMVFEFNNKLQKIMWNNDQVWSNTFLPTGIKRFKGQYIHSLEYKNPEKFRGKKIVVVGIGNSGTDLAIELSHVASQVWFLKFSFPDVTLSTALWDVSIVWNMCQVYPHTASILIVNDLFTLVFLVDILAIHFLKREWNKNKYFKF